MQGVNLIAGEKFTRQLKTLAKEVYKLRPCTFAERKGFRSAVKFNKQDCPGIFQFCTSLSSGTVGVTSMQDSY